MIRDQVQALAQCQEEALPLKSSDRAFSLAGENPDDDEKTKKDQPDNKSHPLFLN